MIGAGEEDPEQLLANPRNWRVHPQAQQKALEGVLKQVGWVQNVIVNKRTGYVVDGHARVAMAISRGERVPVVYVDLSEEEEVLVLATLDPLSAMAGTDKDLLAGLVAELPAVTNEELAKMLKGQADGRDSLDYMPEPEDFESDAPSLAAGKDRIPLAIVLSTVQARRWREYKDRVGQQQDTAAFVTLMAAVEASA